MSESSCEREYSKTFQSRVARGFVLGILANVILIGVLFQHPNVYMFDSEWIVAAMSMVLFTVLISSTIFALSREGKVSEHKIVSGASVCLSIAIALTTSCVMASQMFVFVWPSEYPNTYLMCEDDTSPREAFFLNLFEKTYVTPKHVEVPEHTFETTVNNTVFKVSVFGNTLHIPPPVSPEEFKKEVREEVVAQFIEATKVAVTRLIETDVDGQQLTTTDFQKVDWVISAPNIAVRKSSDQARARNWNADDIVLTIRKGVVLDPTAVFLNEPMDVVLPN